MSQLSLFDLPEPTEPDETPKSPKPKPKPQPEPPSDEPGPIHAWSPAADPIIDIDVEDKPSYQCFVIGCGCVSMGASIGDKPVCDLHNTDATIAVVATGSWPAWYMYEGEYRIVPTARRFNNLGHIWAGIGIEKKCSNCSLLHDTWWRDKFSTPCADYEQPDMTKGLFRP